MFYPDTPFVVQVFGSAGLIGNPMGFARSLSLGIRDFLSVPVRNVFQVCVNSYLFNYHFICKLGVYS